MSAVSAPTRRRPKVKTLRMPKTSEATASPLRFFSPQACPP
ncbi:MAG TPA: hypothetical protein VG148_05175 [Pyrinomonadaceae bacterium]|nr:hypothetical protein [Pyrinomonadaceae bacterium]